MELLLGVLFLSAGGVLALRGLGETVRDAHPMAVLIADATGTEKSVWLLRSTSGSYRLPDGSKLKRRGDRLFDKESGEFFGLLVDEPEEE